MLEVIFYDGEILRFDITWYKVAGIQQMQNVISISSVVRFVNNILQKKSFLDKRKLCLFGVPSKYLTFVFECVTSENSETIFEEILITRVIVDCSHL